MRLIRLTKDADTPTYGVLLNEGIPFALTLERPWLENMPKVSCILPGTYKAVRHLSPKFGETFWLQDVPGRSEILFHKGNRDDDSRGCILIGESFNHVMGEAGITRSEEGFREFLNILEGRNEFTIDIEDV